MKKNIVGLLLFVTLFSLHAESSTKISLKNSTGKNLVKIYISSSATDFWGENLLLSNPLEPNTLFAYSILFDKENSRYDIKAVAEDGSIYLYFEADFLKIRTVILNANNFDKTISPDAEAILPVEEKEALEVKSEQPKNYKNGYKQGYLNGYEAGLKDGYNSAKEELFNSDKKKESKK